jgi:hypothetical protein
MSKVAIAAILQDLMDAGEASVKELMAASGYDRDVTGEALLRLREQGLTKYVNTRIWDGSLCRIHSLTPAGIDAALAATPPTNNQPQGVAHDQPR